MRLPGSLKLGLSRYEPLVNLNTAKTEHETARETARAGSLKLGLSRYEPLVSRM